jgi:predicted RNA-binding Zn-ribbon protein involved in translation (DUF1610 family)
VEEEPLGEEPFDEDEAPRPLESEERENVQADLGDLDRMRTAFEPRGMRGVVIACPDCGNDHYYGWDLLKESLEHMLDSGEPRMHEPAYEPREEDYILWDYGKGYVDALAEAGLESSEQTEVKECAWCQTPVEPHFKWCPTCGRSMAPLRLLAQLRAKGIDEREARVLLLQAGFEPLP